MFFIIYQAGFGKENANFFIMTNIGETPTTTEFTWQKRALKAEAQVGILLEEMDYLKAKIRVLTAKRFSPSSEKMNKDQLQLFDSCFNEVEATTEPLAPEPELITVPEHKRAKRKGKKNQCLDGLPENIIEHRLPEEKLTCSCCGTQRHVIRQEITKELQYVPPKIYVDVHIQDIYGCRGCEVCGDGSEPVVIAAPKPKRAFPGSIASPSIVANIIDEKYVMATPLYRQEQQWARRGVGISRQNMANWTIHAANNWLLPIYNRMKEELLKQDIMAADDTTIQVLQEDGKKAESKSYMWLYRSGRYGPGIVLYEYQPSRAGEHPREFLKDFQGYLMTDGYAGYNHLPGVTNIGCFAHARRKFDEAIKAAGKTPKKPKASEGLAFIRRLYAVEHELADVEPEDRYKGRLLRSKPVLEAFLAWLQDTNEVCLAQSHLGKAIYYCLNQWDKLNGFLLDGRLEIDNNRAERSIKPFVIARKNFLFCKTPEGANASAVIFSIVESAKENGLKPYDYLEYLFQELPNATSNDLEKFMPWSQHIPDHIHTPKKK